MSDVQLTISKDVVAPIVEAKIKEAVLASLGGADAVIEKVTSEIMHRKVDANGKVSSYSHDNKYSWIDAVLTNQIKQLVEQKIKDILLEKSKPIENEIIRQLQTKKGASIAAKALLDALNGTFQKSWTSSIQIDLMPQRYD